MTFLSKYQTALMVLALLGFASVFGAFFVDHTMAETCPFNIASNCPLMLSSIDESIHHLETFSAYFSGVTTVALITLLLVTSFVFYFARDVLIRIPAFSHYRLDNFKYLSPTMADKLLRWISLHNKQSSDAS